MFAIPQRFNSDLADEGVWYEVRGEEEQFYGKFKCRLIDEDSSTYKKSLERVTERHRKLHRNKEAPRNEVLRDIFLDCVLVEWDGVPGADGKDVPFTKDNARNYFSTPGTGYVLNELWSYACDVGNYGKSDKKEVAKNS